ncbi:MAG TPA: amidohydrolase family protein [Solirubrobacteraceae bacterium]|nr:amidohydrolase family protein [Solirubrobacteraceae bacterium]
MAVAPGSPHDEILRPLHAAHLAALPAGATWFDAHTHIGHDDPDGFKADPEDLLAGLDSASQHRALVFPSQEPGGYPPANDRVLEACAASGGRLQALARIDPNAEGALDEARRCLEAGARGFKLHPRSDRFALPHPVVEQVVALAGEARAAVLFHAGRGIPHLGESVVHMAREHHGARLILAHAGISDTGWIAPYAAELPNLFFDTAWWQVSDLLALFTTVPPGRILYASDMPYGSPLFHSLAFLRCALSVGLEGDALRAIAGESVERVLAGEEPVDVGPAPGSARLGPRDVAFERVVAHCSVAANLSFREQPVDEPLALAQLACHRADEHPVAVAIGALLAAGRDAVARGGGTRDEAMHAAIGAQLLAGTAALDLV